MKPVTKTTATCLVFEALRRADDFRTARQLLAELPTLNVNQVSAALCNLRNYRAVECIEQERALWWFATPAQDTRRESRDNIIDRPITRSRKHKKEVTDGSIRRLRL